MNKRVLLSGMMVLILALIAATGALVWQLFDIQIPDEPTTLQRPKPPTANAYRPSRTTTDVVLQAPQARPTPATPPPAPVAVTPANAIVDLPPLEPPAAPPAGPPPQKEPVPPGVGTAVYVQGTITATRPSQRRRELTKDSRILLNDVVETGVGAKLRLAFDDRSLLTLGESTAITIDEYVYDAANPEQCTFTTRFTKGVSRLVTGLIAQSNPRKVHVRTSMTTIGIRGCDLGFTAGVDEDRVYVFELSDGQSIHVETSRDGSPIMNPLSGDALPLDPAKATTIDIDKGGQMVSVVRGHGVTVKAITADDQRDLIRDTSHLPPARYRVQQEAGTMSITLQPATDEVKPEPRP